MQKFPERQHLNDMMQIFANLNYGELHHNIQYENYT